MLSDPSPDFVPDLESSSEHSRMEEPEAFIEVSSDPIPPRRGGMGGRGMFLGLVLGIAVVVGGMALAVRSTKQTATAPARDMNGTQQSVSVATVQWMPVAQTFPAQGSVEARNWVSVMPTAPGVQIKSIAVKEGDTVKGGEIIAVLDNSIQQDQLSQAKAQATSAQAQVASAETQLVAAQAQAQGVQSQLAAAKTVVAQKKALMAQQKASLSEAQSNRRRYASLAKAGAISAQELESRSTTAITAQASVQVAQADIENAEAGINNALAQLDQAQAAVNTARAGVNQARANYQNAIARQRELENQLEKASLVKAPSSGIIAKKNANVGDLTGTTPLFSIIQDSTVELQAKVPETLLPKVTPGSSAFITSDSDQRIRYQGTVREINPTLDVKTRQALVKINLPQSDLLKPGMFLRAMIAYDTTQALTIPTGAVISQPDGKNIVYVLGPDNTAKSRTVVLGDPTKGRMVVKEGLSVGDRVVVSGAGFVKDGARVNVVP